MGFGRAASADTLTEPARITALRNFGSIWFIIPQGTGVLALCFWLSDYQFNGLNIIAYIAWAIAIISFFVTLATYIARVVCFPRHVVHQLADDASELASIASMPTAATAIVQMLILVLGNRPGWSTTCYVLWWIVFGMSFAVATITPQIYITTNPPGFDNLLPSSQLPVVAILTVAATGGALCSNTSISVAQQTPVIALSYLLVGLAVPLAIYLDTIFFSRLLDQVKEVQRQSPRSERQTVAFQTMICAGPWGQSGVALLLLGNTILTSGLSVSTSSAVSSEFAFRSIGYFSMFIGFLFWGQSTFWWILSLLCIAHSVVGTAADKRGISFQMAAWSLVFPWGVYINGAIHIGKLLDSDAFRIWAAILTISLTILWLLCTAFTIKGVINGSLLGLEHGWRENRAASSMGRRAEEGAGRSKHS